MDFNRSDSTQISASARQKLLVMFQIDQYEPLAVGTEAEVYELDEHHLLKLYADPGRLPHLETLHHFYQNIDTSHTSLTLPAIVSITPQDGLLAVVEKRLAGVPLETVLPGLEPAAVEKAENLYLDAVFQLKNLHLLTPPTTYLLFDEQQKSLTAHQSFPQFYADFLAQKTGRVAPYFAASTPKFAQQAQALGQAIRHTPPTPLAVVHGDFFPGNVLVDEALTQVCGVIDFGSFTLAGNYLLDVAGAFGFYQMYAPHRHEIRQRLLPKILGRLQPAERPVFFQFLLANAILTSDLYAPTPDPRGDGHFEWAAELVATEAYWEQALSG